MDARERIAAVLRESARLKEESARILPESVAAAADLMIEALRSGRKVVAFGNGGSAADAVHFTAELVGRYTADRPSLPAMALNENVSSLTAISNDYGYERVFARQVEGLVHPGDVVVAISTSGTSPNVLAGLEAARRAGARTVGLTGRDGGAMPALCDACVIVPSQSTARIQETHITVIHIWCELIEAGVFGGG
ncbi:MAG: D-sedoheptulose 7-phosphate isomerase [Candidatus Sumerlaeaceae bacterium]|nr:D-sedoheptulose 7-phosphate isomerase [Candidatus Sumerlaeaceae bacterium]